MGDNRSEISPSGRIYRGNKTPHEGIDVLPPPPPWRVFNRQAQTDRGRTYQATEKEIELVNAALYLRRPLLVTGKPGVGKTSLAYAVAYELGLSDVLVWSITTRSTLQQGLYTYDAIARLQDASLAWSQGKDGKLSEPKRAMPIVETADGAPDIGRYIRLGPLGTAFFGLLPASGASKMRPRVLLIDEIDKSDIDLPNDLLNVFEEGKFEIPELSRLPDDDSYRKISIATCDGNGLVSIERGQVRCEVFPLVIMTSNGEREFPPAFLRRCLRLTVDLPPEDTLRRIIEQRLAPGTKHSSAIKELLDTFLELRDQKKKELATDQLLNAVFLVMKDIDPVERSVLRDALLQPLSEISFTP
jgi:MoxR-like ATPase